MSYLNCCFILLFLTLFSKLQRDTDCGREAKTKSFFWPFQMGLPNKQMLRLVYSKHLWFLCSTEALTSQLPPPVVRGIPAIPFFFFPFFFLIHLTLLESPVWARYNGKQEEFDVNHLHHPRPTEIPIFKWLGRYPNRKI